jgi:hypothetical protein
MLGPPLDSTVGNICAPRTRQLVLDSYLI